MISAQATSYVPAGKWLARPKFQGLRVDLTYEVGDADTTKVGNAKPLQVNAMHTEAFLTPSTDPGDVSVHERYGIGPSQRGRGEALTDFLQQQDFELNGNPYAEMTYEGTSQNLKTLEEALYNPWKDVFKQLPEGPEKPRDWIKLFLAWPYVFNDLQDIDKNDAPPSLPALKKAILTAARGTYQDMNGTWESLVNGLSDLELHKTFPERGRTLSTPNLQQVLRQVLADLKEKPLLRWTNASSIATSGSVPEMPLEAFKKSLSAAKFDRKVNLPEAVEVSASPDKIFDVVYIPDEDEFKAWGVRSLNAKPPEYLPRPSAV